MVNLRIDNEILKGVKLVVFDKDGTLMDFYHYWSNMLTFRVDLVQQKLGFNDIHNKDIVYAMGVDLKNRRLKSEGPVGLKKREIVLQAMVDALARIGYPDTQNICFEVFKEVDRLSVDRFPEIIRPIPGMHELIDNLHDNGCKIAIATTDKSERARLAIKFLGIANKVDFVAGDDMVEHPKPAPDMLYMILSKTDTLEENGVMVGDAISDVEMGLNAGLKASIGVCSGLTSREEMLKRTKFVIEDVSAIGVE